jgi:hypothetical protein
MDRGLLRPKAEVEWRATFGEQFSSEDVKEQVIFAFFFERGFNLPMGDFFWGLLYYYNLELVHLVPNSITVVSTFIHFCEAYLGISPHFLLWRYLFCVKSTGKRSWPVGAVMFTLRSGLKAEWIDTDPTDNTAGWRSEWFYIVDQLTTRNQPFANTYIWLQYGCFGCIWNQLHRSEVVDKWLQLERCNSLRQP